MSIETVGNLVPQVKDPGTEFVLGEIETNYLRIPASDGVVLSALLFRPEVPTVKVFLLIPGLNGAVLGGFHDYRPLAKKLTSKGFSLLILNMRSSNSFATAKFEDCKIDIGAAVEWLKKNDLSRIALFGTSLGGPRIMYYISQGADIAIEVIGLIASIRSPYLATTDGPGRDHMDELDEVLIKARKLVAEGKEFVPVSFNYFLPGRPQIMSAKSFLSFFGTPDDTQAGTIMHGHHVKVPALIIHGTDDEVSHPNNSKDIYESLTSAPERKLVYVEGANHYLASGWICETYAKLVTRWVAEKISS